MYPGLCIISLSRLAPSSRHSSIKETNYQTMKGIEFHLVSEPVHAVQAEHIPAVQRQQTGLEDTESDSSYDETAF